MILPNNKVERELLNKAELKNLLKEYKGILNNSMMDYLDSLIGLEFSVIRDYISDSDRKILSELEIYRKVAIYNIYNRVVDLVDRKSTEKDIYIKESYNRNLVLKSDGSSDGKNIELFTFEYGKGNFLSKKNIPNGYKSMRIGDVSLYQTLENRELKEKELDRILEKLEYLYNKRNLYPDSFGTYGGPASTWEFRHEKEIKKYEELYTQLDNKKELSDDDKREIEVTGFIRNLLLEDYGVKPDDFEEVEINPFSSADKTELKKIFVKKMPNLTITDHIKYI